MNTVLRKSLFKTLSYFKYDKNFIVLFLMFNIFLSVSQGIAYQELSNLVSELQLLIRLLMTFIQTWVTIIMVIRFKCFFEADSIQENIISSLRAATLLTPRFIYYSLMYVSMATLGIILFIIPGIYILVTYFYVPFLSILNDESEGSYFQHSKNYAEGFYPYLFLFVLILLGSELSIEYLNSHLMGESLNTFFLASLYLPLGGVSGLVYCWSISLLLSRMKEI